LTPGLADERRPLVEAEYGKLPFHNALNPAGNGDVGRYAYSVNVHAGPIVVLPKERTECHDMGRMAMDESNIAYIQLA
jgi:hypothetical protein